MTTSERLERALALAKRVLKPDPCGPDLERKDVTELAASIVHLDAALARGAPFPATWCRAVPTGTTVTPSLQRAATLARAAAVGVARRVLASGATAKLSAADVILMARSAVELHFALMRGGDYPPDWLAPPARLRDATKTGPPIAA